MINCSLGVSETDWMKYCLEQSWYAVEMPMSLVVAFDDEMVVAVATDVESKMENCGSLDVMNSEIVKQMTAS